jgi:hypothetical protein
VFDQECGELMREEFGVERFHMQDFAHFKHEYATWRGMEDRRKRLLRSLLRLINERVQRLYVTTLVLDDFRVVDAMYQATETFGGPYAMAAAFSILSAAEWIFEEKDPEDVLAFLVEKGDAGQEALLRILDQQFDGTAASFVHFIQKQDSSGADIRPLYVPDLIAYEYRSEHAVYATTGRVKLSQRAPLRGIRETLFPRVGIVHRENLERMCVEAAVPTR